MGESAHADQWHSLALPKRHTWPCLRCYAWIYIEKTDIYIQSRLLSCKEKGMTQKNGDSLSVASASDMSDVSGSGVDFRCSGPGADRYSRTVSTAYTKVPPPKRIRCHGFDIPQSILHDDSVSYAKKRLISY